VEPVGSDDNKYITFKRSTFYEMMGYLALPPWRDHQTGELIGTSLDSAPLAEEIEREAEQRCVKDAVVIRRQDTFASPCLLTYASMISMVAKHHPDDDKAKELLLIADYFQRQGELAGDEARGLPTL